MATFSIIGCGRVGVTLGVFLSGANFKPAGFFSQSKSSAVYARDMAGSGGVFESALEASRAADIVFITTPDTQIRTVCDQIAAAGGVGPEKTVFHLSGALASDILQTARDCGAQTGSIHPLQAFTPYEKGGKNPFDGANISVEGSSHAVALGEQIIGRLRGRAFTISTEFKMLYHAAAVVASNYLVTLEHFALSLLEKSGLEEKQAFEILDPLIQGTLSNIRDKGRVHALTGPVARGDHEIVAAHLAAIDKDLPEFSHLYQVLGGHTLKLATQGQGLKKEAEQQLSRLFYSEIS